MKLAIIIATLGRRQILAQTLADIARQTRRPDVAVIVGAHAEDLPFDSPSLPFPIRSVISEIGLTRQRNAGIEAAFDSDLIVFLDDDFLLAADYLAEVERLFSAAPDVAMATGTVLADGIHGPGLAFDAARAQLIALTEDQSPRAQHEAPTEVYNCYGCNMALRTALVVRHGLRFDPRLPFYGWLEDVDFSRQMARHGRVVKSTALRGIHLGTKAGRSSGRKLGYSQVANPLYLRSKRTMIGSRALSIMARNLTANLVKSLRPEPEVDRRGRLSGNLLALSDLMSGRLCPERVRDLS